MLFSVIVPIYKAEKYLNKCVDSILGQTFTDFELILVDDGSPDKCPEICDARFSFIPIPAIPVPTPLRIVCKSWYRHSSNHSA